MQQNDGRSRTNVFVRYLNSAHDLFEGALLGDVQLIQAGSVCVSTTTPRAASATTVISSDNSIGFAR